MREIKFRAWLKEKKKMMNVNEINFKERDINEAFFCFYEIELMQYTGLKDKNGKEIYEGDIVAWIDSDGNKRQNKVFFEQGAFRICNSCFEISEYGELEVIGNVYENPELLGEK